MATQEEVVVIPEAQKKESKQKMCVISREGVTLFGFHLSWVVIVLVAVLVLVYLHKTGMLGDSVSEILGSDSGVSKPSVPVPTTAMTGGKLRSFNVAGKSEMRMKMGH
jgi:hypothetical protein